MWLQRSTLLAALTTFFLSVPVVQGQVVPPGSCQVSSPWPSTCYNAQQVTKLGDCGLQPYYRTVNSYGCYWQISSSFAPGGYYLTNQGKYSCQCSKSDSCLSGAVKTGLWSCWNAPSPATAACPWISDATRYSYTGSPVAGGTGWWKYNANCVNGATDYATCQIGSGAVTTPSCTPVPSPSTAPSPSSSGLPPSASATASTSRVPPSPSASASNTRAASSSSPSSSAAAASPSSSAAAASPSSSAAAASPSSSAAAASPSSGAAASPSSGAAASPSSGAAASPSSGAAASPSSVAASPSPSSDPTPSPSASAAPPDVSIRLMFALKGSAASITNVLQPSTGSSLREALACITSQQQQQQPSSSGDNSIGGGNLASSDITITSLRDLSDPMAHETTVDADAQVNTMSSPSSPSSSCSSRLLMLRQLQEGEGDERSLQGGTTGLAALTTVELRVAIRAPPKPSTSPAAVVNTRRQLQAPIPSTSNSNSSTAGGNSTTSGTVRAMQNLVAMFAGQVNVTALPWQEVAAMMTGVERQALSVIYRFSDKLKGSILPGKFTKSRQLQGAAAATSDPFSSLDYSKVKTALETTPASSSTLPPAFGQTLSALNSPAMFTLHTFSVDVDGNSAGSVDVNTATTTGAAIISAVVVADEKQSAASGVLPSNPPGAGPDNGNGAGAGAAASGVNNALILGLILSLLLALCIGVAFFFYYRSKRAKRAGGVTGSSAGAKRRRSTNGPRRGSVALTALYTKPTPGRNSAVQQNPLASLALAQGNGSSSESVIGGNGATVNNLKTPEVVFNPLMAASPSSVALLQQGGGRQTFSPQAAGSQQVGASPLSAQDGQGNSKNSVKTIVFDEDGNKRSSPNESPTSSSRDLSDNRLGARANKKSFGTLQSGRDLFRGAGDGGGSSEPASFAARALSNKQNSRRMLNLDDDDEDSFGRSRLPGSAGNDDAANAFGPVKPAGAGRSASAAPSSTNGNKRAFDEEPSHDSSSCASGSADGGDNDETPPPPLPPRRTSDGLSGPGAQKLSFRQQSSRRRFGAGGSSVGASSRSIPLSPSSAVTPVGGSSSNDGVATAPATGQTFASQLGVASTAANSNRGISKLMSKASSRGLLSLSAATSSVLSPAPPAALPTPPAAATQQQRMDALRGFASNRMVLGGGAASSSSFSSGRLSSGAASAAAPATSKDEDEW